MVSAPIRKPACPADAGFTLAELAIVLLITGLLITMAASMATPLFREARRVETQAKLDNIAKAIDFYAAQNLRVPCPASPDRADKGQPWGFEEGSGQQGDQVPAGCGSDPKHWEGIVPFRTLNIPVAWITDAGGHYITYAVSPAFTQDVSKDALPVHARCRTADWFTGNIIYEHNVTDPRTRRPAIDVLQPKNARKARFCCAGAMTGHDLVILDAQGQSQIAVPRQSSAASYRPANIPFPDPWKAGSEIPDNDRATAPVYVLVSHGWWGAGAFSGRGRARFALGHATPAEQENANGDRTFVEIPVSERTGKEKSFDDTVLWRTQDMIFAEQGRSCALP